jgi:hypothetical protein
MRELEWHQERLLRVRQELEALDVLSSRAVHLTLESVTTDRVRSTQGLLVNEWCAMMQALEAAYLTAHPYLDKESLVEFHHRCMVKATGDFVPDEEDQLLLKALFPEP